MKAKELRLTSELELENKLSELRKELMKANSQVATGTIPKNPGRLREMKRTIAKILTVKKEKTNGGSKKE